MRWQTVVEQERTSAGAGRQMGAAAGVQGNEHLHRTRLAVLKGVDWAVPACKPGTLSYE